MSTVTLCDNEWLKILEFLRTCPDVYVGQEAACHRLLEAVLWITRNGTQWRLLPESYCNWNSIYKRFARWCDKGIWAPMHQHVSDNRDMEHLILDSTSGRCHSSRLGRAQARPNTL